MVHYLDPEDHPELGGERHRYCSPGERLTRARERNAAPTDTMAIEAMREVALRKLGTRACSRSELTSAVGEWGFGAKITVEVADRFEAVGLIDDQACADALIHSRFPRIGAPGHALHEVLVRKGLDSSTVEHALFQIDQDDGAGRVAQLVARKCRSLVGVPREITYRRPSSMLARKGYSPPVTSAAVRDALGTWGEKDSSTEEAQQWKL